MLSVSPPLTSLIASLLLSFWACVISLDPFSNLESSLYIMKT